MKKMKTLFTDSFYELKDLRTFASAAMLLAITVVLGFYRLQLTDFLRIGLDPVAKELTGMLFGPVAGCMVGGLSDFISYLIKPVGRFFPGFTVSAMLGGVIYGTVLYKKPLSLWRVVAANSLVAVFINLFLNTFWLTVLYGDAFFVLLPARAVKQLVMLPIDVLLFYTTAKILSRAKLLGVLKGNAR